MLHRFRQVLGLRFPQLAQLDPPGRCYLPVPLALRLPWDPLAPEPRHFPRGQCFPMAPLDRLDLLGQGRPLRAQRAPLGRRRRVTRLIPVIRVDPGCGDPRWVFCAWVDPMALLILIDRSFAGAEEKFDGTL